MPRRRARTGFASLTRNSQLRSIGRHHDFHFVDGIARAYTAAVAASEWIVFKGCILLSRKRSGRNSFGLAKISSRW